MWRHDGRVILVEGVEHVFRVQLVRLDEEGAHAVFASIPVQQEEALAAGGEVCRDEQIVESVDHFQESSGSSKYALGELGAIGTIGESAWFGAGVSGVLRSLL